MFFFVSFFLISLKKKRRQKTKQDAQSSPEFFMLKRFEGNSSFFELTTPTRSQNFKRRLIRHL